MKIFQYQRGKNFGTMQADIWGHAGTAPNILRLSIWCVSPLLSPPPHPVTIWRLEESLRWSGRSGHEKIPTSAAN